MVILQTTTFRIVLPAQKATPNTKLGTALSQRTIPMADFCKKFNDLSKTFPLNTSLTAEITSFPNKTYAITILGIPVSIMLKQALGIESGSKKTGRDMLPQKLTEDICNKIAEDLYKRPNNITTILKLKKSVIGTARSMGLQTTE